MKKITKQDFINRSTTTHGSRYDYSLVDYINTSKNVYIICSEHGGFWQSPREHYSGQGCPKCGILSRTKTRSCKIDSFIDKSINIHGDKYDYSKVNYINNKTKICLICLEHGEFWQTPDGHINQKQGCPVCANKNLSINKTKDFTYFMGDIKSIHGDKYDYSKVNYKGLKTRVKIICPEHGEFLQTPGNHIKGHGCPFCAGVNKLTTNIFIERALKVHGDKYNYSKVKYINSNTKVCIICLEHGEFWQKPSGHVNQKHGCPICSESRLECKIRVFLKDKDINFIQQHRDKWLKRQSLDFYLPDYNIGIECQGEQHFISKKFFGGENGFKNSKARDKRKLESCISNNVRLIYFSNVSDALHCDCDFKICKNESEVFNEIKLHINNKQNE